MQMKWWQTAVFYQIFLRSFKDSDNDGIGDLKGLISKVDYLKYLGIDAVYITPFFPSPYFDSGFDITDYYDVDPKVGTQQDVVSLIDVLHNNNIKLVIDIPINHTSIYHKWFINSSASKTNEYSDYYIWSDEIPNNWKSNYGGSSWSYNEERKQYYMHSFSDYLPDLNWRCESLVLKMLEVFKFYLDLGVDGVRLSCANLIIKDSHLRDNPNYPGFYKNRYLKQRHIFDRNRPYSHKIINRIRSLFDTYEDRVLVGDIVVAPPGEPELVASYYGMHKNELHLAFDYSIASTPFKPKSFRLAAKRWIEACGTSWPSWVFSNHDYKRIKTRFKGDFDKTKLVTLFLLTQKGTPFLYYGEELGLEDSLIPKRRQKDLMRKKLFFFQNSRDGARGPMLWNKSQYCGFSKVRPYLPQGKARKNVKNQKADKNSMLNYYRSFISLRKTQPALIKGETTFIDGNDENIIAFIRSTDDEALLILLNFSKKTRLIELNNLLLPFTVDKVIFSTNPVLNKESLTKDEILLSPFEGAIFSLQL